MYYHKLPGRRRLFSPLLEMNRPFALLGPAKEVGYSRFKRDKVFPVCGPTTVDERENPTLLTSRVVEHCSFVCVCVCGKTALLKS